MSLEYIETFQLIITVDSEFDRSTNMIRVDPLAVCCEDLGPNSYLFKYIERFTWIMKTYTFFE